MHAYIFVVALFGEVVLVEDVFEDFDVDALDVDPIEIEGAEPFIVVFPQPKVVPEVLVRGHFSDSVEAIAIDDSVKKIYLLFGQGIGFG